MEGKNEGVPVDIQTEILLRMPLKSLLRFICVSKKWASIIRGKNFRDLYLLRSMTRPRVMFTFCRKLHDPTPDVLFHSVYQEEKPLLSSGQQQMRLSSEPEYAISAPIRGLVCLQSETKVALCNPGTKKFLILPEFRVRNSLVNSYFGYDEVTDVFKVLCRTSSLFGGARRHHVITVGSDEESWRPIVCKNEHCPVTNGVCKGGFLYYGAWTGPENKSIVMSFNVSSEEFTVIELPKGVHIEHVANLVNYYGEIAFVNYPVNGNGEIEIWVRNEISGEWRVEHVVIPAWRETCGDMIFFFVGTIGTRELVFEINWLLEGSFFVVYYDTVTKNLRKFKIEGVDGAPFHCARTHLNHVDSLLLM